MTFHSPPQDPTSRWVLGLYVYVVIVLPPVVLAMLSWQEQVKIHYRWLIQHFGFASSL